MNIAGYVPVFVLCLAFLQAQASFVVEKHSLSVTAPDNIKGTYDSAIGNFGLPQYGGSLSGVLVYPSSNKDGCKAFSDVGNDFKSGPGELPKMVLLDRGNCFFTAKVWYAQLAGASAVVVSDDKQEALITMDAPEDDPESAKYTENITIPSALVQKEVGDSLKSAIKAGNMVTVSLDWREALPHPDERVEYGLWTNSNDECGPKCDSQATFLRDFKGYALTLEQGGYTLFTPHYITWFCPAAYLDSKQCRTQCINNGRYCAPDPEENFDIGYDGKDVVVENLRELCVFRLANETGRPWLWWDYVTDFKLRCKMSEKKYNQECAETVISALGIDSRRVRDCVGDPTKDADNPILKAEQEGQVGVGDRGDITILPTLVINDRQYRGKLDTKTVLKAICSGFKETTDPPVCLGSDVQTNECLDNNGGCWTGYNHTACKDTFRGRVCECPKDPVTGVVFVGDGYTKCEAAGPGRCNVNNGGCWQATSDGNTFTACQDNLGGTGCQCPSGFTGDGISCEDVDECASNQPFCKCSDCNCKNTFGSYECSCSGDSVYIKDHDTCISQHGGSPSKKTWYIIAGVVAGSLLLLVVISYAVYKYRLRSYMDSEIRAIMAQYMPLDSQNEPMMGGGAGNSSSARVTTHDEP